MSDQAGVTQSDECKSDDSCVDAIATVAAVTIVVLAVVFWLTTL
jgi:hypothetical protein